MVVRRLLVLIVGVVVVVLGGSAAVAAWAGTRASDYFLYSPQAAVEIGPYVDVPGEPPDARRGDPALLLVAVQVRRASLLDRWLGDDEPGVDLVPEEKVIPPGHDDEDLGRQGRILMRSSQQNAAVVAERALGKKVEIRAIARIAAFGPDSPAERAGLREGDEIVEARGRTVRDLDDLRRALEGVRPGERVTLAYRRGADRGTAEVATAPNPDDPKRAVLGVIIAPAEAKLPIPVRYETEGVGGPSAGLGFALEIYSALAKRSVVRGHRVAVTGEILMDGTVAPIGGIKQKTFGATDADADVFLVPEENAAEARRWAEDGLRIVPVGTFAEALDALAELPAA
ncbi:MAG: hypothetical protein AVDCRST_MAG79-2775 [uncultured Thermoleophilia bacterium]|uniref:endopeptidase La n=1 Tax=uncultured Thermoleophilia bacterium TaxID=1497501 RepID=A0A6J4UKC3_9ACTN|nr:MAG: hypothetical protein AVDCRST_MAG79-2775 [uncultured Thermoleophilia bacterium]